MTTVLKPVSFGGNINSAKFIQIHSHIALLMGNIVITFYLDQILVLTYLDLFFFQSL